MCDSRHTEARMAHSDKIAPVMQLRIYPIVIYLLVLCGCVWGMRYFIDKPAQHQLHAVDLVADGGKTIRDLEKTPDGQAFRWLHDDVNLTIAQPTESGILTFQYWIAPERVANAVHINTSQIPLPPSTPLQQRKISILVFHATGVPQSTFGIQFVAMPKSSIAWAFTHANWQALTPTPHPLILGAIGLFWLISALSIYRIVQLHWVSISVATIGVLAIGMTQVLANSLTALIQNPQFVRNGCIIAISWLVWYVLHRRVVRFFVQAQPPQRLMMGGYMILTLLPPIGMLFTPEPASIAVQEQRQRQKCPTVWTGNRWDVGNNFAILAQCVADNIGWRSIMIRSKNELDYRLFGVSSRVYLGNNDFYFLRRWGDERFPLLQTILHDPIQHQKLRHTITALQAIMQRTISICCW